MAQYFLTTTRKLRNHLAQGKLIIDAEIKRRHQAAKNKTETESENEPRVQDTLDWYESLSKSSGRSVNISNGQIALSLAAIHTTSNLLTNVMYDLAAYPEYIQPLRDEIRAVIAEDGCLKKSSLLKLKLMDSVMKETQRIHPVSMSEFNPPQTPTRVQSSGPGAPLPYGLPRCMYLGSTLIDSTSSLPKPSCQKGNPPIRRNGHTKRRNGRSINTHQ